MPLWKKILKTPGDVFVPILPAIVASGLMMGLVEALAKAIPSFADSGWFGFLDMVANTAFALLPILSGFRFDMVQGRLAFAPKVEQSSFRCFWSVASGYGEYTQCADSAQLTVFEGKLRLSGFGVPNAQAVKEVRIDGTACNFTVQGDWLLFPETVVARMIEIKR